jgi:glycosyltransferase involved in cell wall biosynthesis
MPQVSIIIPNYNHGKFLKQRIDSVLNQTFQDFELIILDDFSSDNSKNIIEEYRNNNKISHIIYNDINSGSTFRQWQKGIELTTGQYIWIAESDDWCEPTLLENLVTGLSSDNCIVAFCQSYCTDGSKISWVSQSPYLSEYREGKDFVKSMMIMGNSIFNASMVVWRKSAFEKISNTFMEFQFCGDWLFWIELCMQGDVFITGKALNYFRKHNQDISGKAYKTGYNFFEEI